MDSVAMVRLFLKGSFNIGLAHINFNLRAGESDADETFVKELAQELNIPCYINGFKTAEIAKDRKISIEMAARALRYEWLEQIRKEMGYACIATAHHQNDVAETVLLNLTKGCGISGLHGIAARSDKIIRPLLPFSRTYIEEWMNTRNYSYRTDSTNIDTSFQRNLIRLEVLPVLSTINPAVAISIYETSLRIADAEKLYNLGLKMMVHKIFWCTEKQSYISISKLLKSDAPATILFEIVKDYRFSSDLSRQIFSSLLSRNTGQIFYSSTHRLLRDDHLLILSPLAEDAPFFIIKEKDNHIHLPHYYLSWKTKPAHRYTGESRPSVACMDSRHISWPLKIRTWKEGDYFYPLGLKKRNSEKPARKKISKYFKDQKLSPAEKEKTLIMEDNEGRILWVMNLRLDERCKVTSGTSSFIRFEIKHKVK